MRKLGSLTVSVDVLVAFHDVDVAAIVWHGHYLKYLENARWALMSRIGFNFDDMVASGYAWPIVELQVKYVQAARFGDRLSVRASLIEWQNRLEINYLVTQAVTNDRVARARTVQVAVDARSGVLQFTTPQILLDRVQAAIAAPVAAVGTGHK
jgi:acyl-CoA thioester hydrolase